MCSWLPSSHLFIFCENGVVIEWCSTEKNPGVPLAGEGPKARYSCSCHPSPWKCGRCSCQHFTGICMCVSRQTWERLILSNTWHIQKWRKFYLILWEQWQRKLPRCWFAYQPLPEVVSCICKICLLSRQPFRIYVVHNVYIVPRYCPLMSYL